MGAASMGRQSAPPGDCGSQSQGREHQEIRGVGRHSFADCFATRLPERDEVERGPGALRPVRSLLDPLTLAPVNHAMLASGER